MLTMIMGWDIDQWRAAFSEADVLFDELDCLRAAWACRHECLRTIATDSQLELMTKVQAAWDDRRSYAPLRSPLVIVRGCLQQEVARC